MRIIRPALAVLLGIFLLFVGVGSLNKTEVKCGYQVMHEGDQCKETQHGKTTAVRDYSAQKSDNATSGWFGIGMGVLFLVGGALVLFSRLSRSVGSSA